MAGRTYCLIGVVLCISRFVVIWSRDGIFTERQTKIFESRDPANWFAKDMEKVYNYVKVYVARQGDFDE